MPDMIKVRAVPGLMLPYEAPRAGHVGYRAATKDETPDHVIPCTLIVDGKTVRADKPLKRVDEDVEVPNTVYYRRGLADGDIVKAEAVLPMKSASQRKSEV